MKKLILCLVIAVLAMTVLTVAAYAGEELPGLWYGASDTEKFPNTYPIICEEATSWGSSNQSVATVADGIVTAQGEGSAFITAYGSDGVIDTWSVSVTARKVQSLSVRSVPVKTQYTIGSHFDPKGLVIDVVYNNEEKETISDTSLLTYDPSLDQKLGTGDTYVTVSYGGIFVDVPITVYPLEVSSIEISKNAKTEYVVGDIPSGIEIKVNYNDGTFIIVTGGSDYSIEPNRPLTEADKSLTITYAGKSATMGITVKPKAASYSIATSGTVAKTEYKVGDKFDATGVTYTIKQGENVIKELKDQALTDAINYTFKPADIGKTSMSFTFTQTIDGVTVNCTLSVSGLKITAATNELMIYDIANVEMKKTKYPIGYKFATSDIDFITYYVTRNTSETQKVYSDEFSDFSNKISLEVLTVNSRGKLAEKTSPTYRQTIEEADVQTDSKGNKFVTLLLVIETGSSSVEYDFDIPVGDSGLYVELPGDVNSDGKVDSNDAIYLLRHTMNAERYPLYPGYEKTDPPSEQITPNENGFITEPCIFDDKIYFTTAKDGEVWLYYTTDSDPISAEDFYDKYRDTVSEYRGTVTAKASKLTSFDISSTAYSRNRYIILAFLADDARGYDFFYPYVLDIESSEMETTGSGLKAYPDTDEESVSVRVQYNGRLYYYLTDNEEDLPTSTTFERMYRDATRFDSYTVEEDDFETIETKGYYYCVICLEYNNQYLSPVIIDMRKDGTYTNGVDDRSNTNGSGFTSVGLNRDLTTVTFTPKVSGTVTLYIVPKGSTTMTEITSVECRADTAGSIDLPSGDLVSLLYGGSAYYIQLTSGSDIYKAILVTRLN